MKVVHLPTNRPVWAIGDIAGRFRELMELTAQIPKEDTIVLVGDLIDRGPESKDVVEWARVGAALEGRLVIALRGNHEDMMIDWCEKDDFTALYPHGCWYDNGGHTTLKSYGVPEDDFTFRFSGITLDNVKRAKALIPKEHLEFLKELPIACWYEKDGPNACLITHAPLRAGRDVEKAFDIESVGWHDRTELSLLWNRGEPRRRDFFQISGHNAHWGIREFVDGEGIFALCIDSSKQRHLTAVRWPREPGAADFTALGAHYREVNAEFPEEDDGPREGESCVKPVIVKDLG